LEPSTDTIQSFAKGIAVIEYLFSADQDASISEISRELGINKSTIYRLLRTLEETGYAEQEPKTGRYRPTMKILMLGNKLLNRVEVRSLANEELRNLAEQSGQAVHLAIRDGNELVIIDKLESTNFFGIRFHIGRRSPLYCTGLGKIFLAAMTEREFENYLDSTTFIQHTPNTLASKDRLREEIEKVRHQGYAIDLQEHNKGISCVATSLKDYRGNVVAAMSVTGPSSEFEPKIDVLKTKTLETARVISARLGHKEDI
jgi:DNA-binding IclR family transcriptional regulator